MEIGENIKKYRKQKGLSQSELADLANISRVAIGNYERGNRTPNIEIVKKIANALDVPLTFFTDEYDFDIYKSLVTEAYSREFDDNDNIIKAVAQEMSDRELMLNLAYADLKPMLSAEINIIKYILKKIDDAELKNITLNSNEMSQLFDFILISSNVKIRELIKHREKRIQEKKE